MAAEIPVFRPLALAIVLGCAAVTVAESDASPERLPAACTQVDARLVSCLYTTPSNSPVAFRVPDGVSSITITARGGTGGPGASGGRGGRAGIVTATLALAVGTKLDLYVGARGEPGRMPDARREPTGGAGGVNGGAPGGGVSTDTGAGGGGGGGGTFVMYAGQDPTDASTVPLLAAGGGGGGGGRASGAGFGDRGPAGLNGGDAGGAAGRHEGKDGRGARATDAVAKGGGGGTDLDGGLGSMATRYSTPAVGGAKGVGGAGANAAGLGAGGGGGGGFYGGGGGGADGGPQAASPPGLGGGGGGSSFADTRVATSVRFSLGPSGLLQDGVVQVTFVPPAAAQESSVPEGTPQCAGKPATMVGTPGADRIVGTPGDDVIVGRGGDDEIDGKGGRDILCGGAGNDTLRGGPGDDVIIGGPGRDRGFGGPGLDSFDGVEEISY
ncbi:hypothetical protein GCM10009547_32640 [Sporichthya brevicatena]|uniref:receptor protein-tyrosine kinase n=1 Tax=Sporichthya brevicatena TaxID=171442 RepID=A0ABP3S5I2_9ACTN